MIRGLATTFPDPVVGWHESKLEFFGLPKRSETRCVVLHWTGGSNLGPGLFETIHGRGLSVHFGVEPNGKVYQYCDADRRCAHAGSADDDDGDGVVVSGNSCSIGIEIVNPAKVSAGGARAPARPLVSEKIHGQTKQATGFTDQQTQVVLKLVKVLCAAYGLPLLVPTAPDGDVLATIMGEAAFKHFRGVCGHLHLTKRKRDPGLALLREVANLQPQHSA